MDATPNTAAPAAAGDAPQATPEAPSATPPATPSVATSAAPTPKKPADAAKRERDRINARLRRFQEKAKKTKNLAELQQLGAAVDKATEGDPATPAKGSGDATPAPVAEVLEPGQLPGWPRPSEVALAEPGAVQLWGELAENLQGTRYAACLAPRKVLVLGKDGQPQEVTEYPVAKLGKATAPILVQVLGKLSAATPTSCAMMGVLAVFGPTAAKHLVELGAALYSRFAAEGAATS